MVIPCSNNLSPLPEAGIPGLRLGKLVPPPQLRLGGGVEPRHVLPGPDGALLPEHPERALVVAVDVVPEPDEHLRVERHDGVPNGLGRALVGAGAEGDPGHHGVGVGVGVAGGADGGAHDDDDEEDQQTEGGSHWGGDAGMRERARSTSAPGRGETAMRNCRRWAGERRDIPISKASDPGAGYLEVGGRLAGGDRAMAVAVAAADAGREEES